MCIKNEEPCQTSNAEFFGKVFSTFYPLANLF